MALNNICGNIALICLVETRGLWGVRDSEVTGTEQLEAPRWGNLSLWTLQGRLKPVLSSNVLLKPAVGPKSREWRRRAVPWAPELTDRATSPATISDESFSSPRLPLPGALSSVHILSFLPPMLTAFPILPQTHTHQSLPHLPKPSFHTVSTLGQYTPLCHLMSMSLPHFLNSDLPPTCSNQASVLSTDTTMRTSLLISLPTQNPFSGFGRYGTSVALGAAAIPTVMNGSPLWVRLSSPSLCPALLLRLVCRNPLLSLSHT